MCGIAGYFSESAKFNSVDLKKMTNALSHRGPDAAGYYANAHGSVGLGHRRLSILDLSDSANQPMYSHSRRYVMAFNGEVYNFQEIRQEIIDYDLAKSGTNTLFSTTSDSEVILEAFERWGMQAIEKFNGMFAIALFDTLSETLYLIRDRMGVKPIFYYQQDNNLVFASETKALLTLNINKELDITAIQDYFYLEYIPGNLTAHKYIKKIPNGHYAIVKHGKMDLYCYYNILDKLNYSPANLSEAKALEQWDELFSSSVKYRQISDVPIGVFLSGGTDSSLVTAKFQEQNTLPVNSFTIGFDVKAYDESGYAAEVAKILKTSHSLTSVKIDSALALVDRILDHYDEPFAATSVIPSLLVCEVARRKATVALGGDGGDELFMGYGYYNWLGRMNTLSRLGRKSAHRLAAAMLNLGNSRMQRAASLINYEDEANLWTHVWSQEQLMLSQKEISSLFKSSYSHSTTLPDWQKINSLEIDPMLKISLFDIKNYLPYNLLYKMDIASMAHSLEVRLPFMDYRLVEYAINLPLKFKINEGTQKYLLKKHLEKYLPKELIYRKKWGFPAPVETWLQKDLNYLIEKYICQKSFDMHGLFDLSTAQNFVAKFRKGELHHYKKIWSIIVFQMWFEKYCQ